MSDTARQRLRLIEALEDALDGMEGMIGYVPEYFQEKWDLPPYIDRAKAVLAEFGDDPEGGTREPSGDQPDSPATPAARLPGGSDDYLTVAFAGDDPRDNWENITPVSPEEFTAGKSFTIPARAGISGRTRW